MKRYIGLFRLAATMLPATALLMLGGFASVSAAMPPGSYLHRPASTARELAQTVDGDHVTLQHYTRVFHTPPAEIVTAFSHLRPARLQNDGIYRVFYVGADGREGYRLRRVRKGTPVWQSPNGTAMLIQVCGNPIGSRPVDAIANAGAQVGRLSTVPDFEPDEPLDTLAIHSCFNTADLRLAQPTAEMPSVAVTQPSLTNVTSTPSLPPIIGPGWPAWQTALAAAAAAGTIGSVFGGHSHPASPGGSVPSIPEPGTGAVLLALAVTAWCFRRWSHHEPMLHIGHHGL
jgi:hypothetical protein